MAEELTDPSREIAGLIDRVVGITVNGLTNTTPPFWEVVSGSVALHPRSPEFFELLAIVRSRLGRFETCLQELKGAGVSEDLAARTSAAIHRVTTVFSASGLGTPWKDVTGRWLTKDDATWFRAFGATMVQYVPLKKLSDEDREAALLAVRDALAEIDQAEDIEAWQQQALRHGYQRLELVLKHFQFFGHEGLTKEVLTTQTAIMAALPERSKRSKFQKMWAALVIVSEIITVVAAPAVGYNAALDYGRAIQMGVTEIHAAIAPAPLQLTGPPNADQESSVDL